jgi:cobaltochelatase CobT
MAGRHPKAFLSYNRFDDEHARGKLSALRTRLEGEIKVQLGAPFQIFQDTIDLTWGADWQQRLLSSIDEAMFSYR